ncbi:hypothetical protein DK842_21420 [Chromobacterium phragmitis]|nr:hypothetical protein DK842_21420 [Chromobacterium phragmitis]
MNSRQAARVLNPLVGRSTADTIENLCLCLDKVGISMASQHDDNSISFFCRSVAAALKFEADNLKDQGPPATVGKSVSVSMTSSSG